MANSNAIEVKRSNLQEEEPVQEGSESEETRQQRELDKAFAEFEELEKSGVKTNDQILELRADLEGDVNTRIDQLENKLAELGVPPLTEETKIKILGNDVDGAVGLEARKAEKHATLLEVLSAAGKIEGKDVLAESLENDPRLKDIQDKMIKEWELANGKPILSFEGQNFMFGDVAAYGRGEKTVTLYQKAREEFAKQFPNEAKMYVKKEAARIYDNPDDDPAIRKVKKEVDSAVLKSLKRVSMGQHNPSDLQTWVGAEIWQKFVIDFPEKAKGYADKVSVIAKALENKDRSGEMTSPDKIQESAESTVVPRTPATEIGAQTPHQGVASGENTPIYESDTSLPDVEILRGENYLSGDAIGIDKFSEGEDLGVVVVDSETIVGHIEDEDDGSWAPSTESREALVEKMAQDLRENPTAQEDAAGFELKTEKQSASQGSQVNLRRVDGPEGPIFFVKDGADRVAASKLANMSEMLAKVEHAKEPDQITTTDRERANEWKHMIERGLIEGQVVKQKGEEFSLEIKKQVLPWCSTERKDFFVANTAYDRVYPEAFDKIKSLKKPNKKIPREVFLDKTGGALDRYLYEPDKLDEYIKSLKDNK